MAYAYQEILPLVPAWFVNPGCINVGSFERIAIKTDGAALGQRLERLWRWGLRHQNWERG